MTFGIPEPVRAAGAPCFTCLRSDSGRAARVTVAGELDIATMSQLDDALRRAQADAPLVVLDLRALRFIDGSAAALIVAADRRIRHAGGRLVVVRAPAAVQWVFELIAFDRRLELVDHPPAATSALSEGAPA
jgi:anti-sigma B factor antagonist